jgi:hypothetical protein
MKKITLLLCLISMSFSTLSYGQCTTNTGGQWPDSTIALVNAGGVESISTNNWPNAEFSLITGVLPGSDYTVTAAMYITVTNTADDSVIVHGANSVSFTAPAGVTDLTIYWHLDAACNTQASGDTVTTIQCTTCTCTPSAAPDAVTSATTPTNGATNVAINYGTPNNISPFEWVAAATGDPAESFNFNLGVTPLANDIGTIVNFPSGGGINFDWEANTTYFWSIDAVNCVGTTSGPVWSFTTAACTASAPNRVITPGPADSAINVALDQTDAVNYPNRLYFTWVDGIGDPGTSFTLNLGETSPPTDNSFAGFPNGDFIFNLNYNTTYYWSVEAINCAGSSAPPPSTVWSFTTEMDPGLSTEDNTLNLIRVYPNPLKNMVTIDTNLNIDNITIFNQLGQNVMQVKGENIINKKVDLTTLTTGLYFMNISAEDKTQSIKIIKE